MHKILEICVRQVCPKEGMTQKQANYGNERSLIFIMGELNAPDFLQPFLLLSIHNEGIRRLYYIQQLIFPFLEMRSQQIRY